MDKNMLKKQQFIWSRSILQLDCTAIEKAGLFLG